VLAIAGSFLAAYPSAFGAGIVTMKSGMQHEGKLDKIGSLNENPLNPSTRGGEVAVKSIVIVDDDLRRTFISNLQVASFAPNAAVAPERIDIKQRIATRGRRINSIGPILRIGPFDEFGRRIFSMQGPNGPIDLVQGITEVSPKHIRVQGLLGDSAYVWDMRIATSAVPRETLSRVLYREINKEDSDERLRVVRLYIQAERYRDALFELEQIIAEFPDLGHLEEQAAALRQLFAQHLLREIELRRDAGQHERVHGLLNGFPNEGIAGETLLRVRDMLSENERRFAQYEQVLSLLKQHAAEIEDPATSASLAPIRAEIQAELNHHTLNRMADYLRLSDDGSMKAEQKIALAVSGWLLGSGSASENLAVAISLFDTRNAVRGYLEAERPHERQEFLDRIKSEEGGAPSYVAKLLENMTPPRVTQAEEHGAPGLYRLTVDGVEAQPKFAYYLQLPPEYNPYRRYPCIVSLNGTGTSAVQQVDWWSGVYSERAAMRQGQAARRGFIVIAPEWQKPHQRDYEYSSREHAAVLFCLRDALRRTSIDTDRVFLSGHSIGGNAAWDIGVAHPDLWAGVIPIVAQGGKYIQRYTENGRGLPMYFVGGEKDSAWLNKNGAEFDRYLRRAGYDVTVVQFQGRGHEHFQDEIQRIFTWMELSAHRRQFFPREFEVESMRPWDNFFWWLELDGFPHESMVLPAQWPPPRGTRAIQSSARILENNLIVVRSGARAVTVWITPEMVDFGRQITIKVDGHDVREEITPSVEVLLEDVRTRADRQHPFWARIES
jgi:predicted esterase